MRWRTTPENTADAAHQNTSHHLRGRNARTHVNCTWFLVCRWPKSTKWCEKTVDVRIFMKSRGKMLLLIKSSTLFNWMYLKLNFFFTNDWETCAMLFNFYLNRGNTQTIMGDELDATIDWELSVNAATMRTQPKRRALCLAVRVADEFERKVAKPKGKSTIMNANECWICSSRSGQYCASRYWILKLYTAGMKCLFHS